MIAEVFCCGDLLWRGGELIPIFRASRSSVIASSSEGVIATAHISDVDIGGIDVLAMLSICDRVVIDRLDDEAIEGGMQFYYPCSHLHLGCVVFGENGGIGCVPLVVFLQVFQLKAIVGYDWVLVATILDDTSFIMSCKTE